jgi:hypothetical protein
MAAFLSGEAAPWLHVEQFGEKISPIDHTAHTVRYGVSMTGRFPFNRCWTSRSLLLWQFEQ